MVHPLANSDVLGGSALRSVLNDLKRDVVSAAAELNIPVAVISRAIAGDRDALALAAGAAALIWPVAKRELLGVTDDTVDNVVIWPSDRAALSSRTLVRDGLDYYEYRDTAMSRISPIRPEWIRMLARTAACDAGDPGLRWNKGHALHQLTLFLGEVDFYYETDGQRVGRTLRTGDSAFIPSWVPHTFASREGVVDAEILAVTFRGRLTADALDDLTVAWDGATSDELASFGAAGFGARLTAMLGAASLSPAWLAAASGLTLVRIEALLASEALPAASDAATVAAALRIPASALAPNVMTDGVVIAAAPGDQIPQKVWSEMAGYRVRPLAASPLTPDARGLIIDVGGTGASDPAYTELRFGLHQYGFVLGTCPVRLIWWSDGIGCEQVLSPGDSFYMKPWTTHAFATDGDAHALPPRVFVFRCYGALGGDALRELAMQDPGARERSRKLQSAWYD